MDEESYRHELRNHFVGQMKNSKFQASKGAVSKEQRSLIYDSSPTHHVGKSSTTQHYKEFAMRQHQKLHNYELDYQRRQQQQHRRSSGGDADRVFCESNFALQHSHQHDSFRRAVDSSNYSMRSVPTKPKEPLPSLPSAVTTNKYHVEENPAYLYETDSNVGGGSEESGKSQKSAKTVVSSQDLRKMVKSQCKLHEVIDETLKKMCVTEGEPVSDEVEHHIKEQPLQMPIPTLHCKRCTDKGTGLSRSSQKDVMTEIAKGDFLDCRSGDTLTISVDDVVNSKVINPMIRKLQRMYLNNLKEEMSLMEDLERLPHKVNEVYKATIFKQKD